MTLDIHRSPTSDHQAACGCLDQILHFYASASFFVVKRRSLEFRECASQPKAHDQWCFCDKCWVMFWNGEANKGTYTAGGGHNAQGHNFKLDFTP
jgi:hypothetical protein